MVRKLKESKTSRRNYLEGECFTLKMMADQDCLDYIELHKFLIEIEKEYEEDFKNINEKARFEKNFKSVPYIDYDLAQLQSMVNAFPYLIRNCTPQSIMYQMLNKIAFLLEWINGGDYYD